MTAWCDCGECEECLRGQISTLRRDLATRDRELAEARDRLGEKRQLVKDATDTIARRNAECDEIAAKLADKERQLGNVERAHDAACVIVAAAQEEAKGLRGVAEDARNRLRFIQSDSPRFAATCAAGIEVLTAALAARQQKPDGKKEDGNG